MRRSHVACIGAHRFVQARFAGDINRKSLPVDEIVRYGSGDQRSSDLFDGTCTDQALEVRTSDLSCALDNALAKVGLEREATQVRIQGVPGSSFEAVAPILDILCRDSKGRPVPVEVKTGRVRRLRRCQLKDKGARAELSEFADTVALRHHAQLAVQVECVRAIGGTGREGYLAYFPAKSASVDAVPRIKLIKLSEKVRVAIARIK